MMNVDKSYTIRFSYAGINQYATFYEVKGKLHNPRLSISYCKEKMPDISNATIEEILEIIKEVSYCNKAEIYLINGSPVNYYNNKKAKKHVSSFADKFGEFIEVEAKKFFEEILEPLMKKNKWFISFSHIGIPVLIKKDEAGEWDNIKNDEREFDFQYLCYQFVSNFRKVDISIKNEYSNHISNVFSFFYGCISSEYYKEKGYLIEDL